MGRFFHYQLVNLLDRSFVCNLVGRKEIYSIPQGPAVLVDAHVSGGIKA